MSQLPFVAWLVTAQPQHADPQRCQLLLPVLNHALNDVSFDVSDVDPQEVLQLGKQLRQHQPPLAHVGA